MNREVGFLEIYYFVMLTLGSSVFTGYMAAVILFSVADARVAQQSVETLIAVTQENKMTPGLYLETLTRINKIVDDSFWLDGALVSCIVMNTVAAIVLLLIFNDLTHGESALYTVAFLLYILMILWITDLVFLFLVLPEITKVNDLFIDFHRVLARGFDYSYSASASASASAQQDSECPLRSALRTTAGGGGKESFLSCDSDSTRTHMANTPPRSFSSYSPPPPDEQTYSVNRINTLHLLLAEPIRYTIVGGLHWNTREFWNSIVAVMFAVCFSVGRFVFLFVISE